MTLGFILLFVIACDFKLYLIHLNVKEQTKPLRQIVDRNQH
jgi:hypothetical protein